MKLNKRELNKLNAIAKSYSGWRNPCEISAMWRELLAAGVEIGMLTNRRENGAGAWRCIQSFTVNGEEVENSDFVYCVYEGTNSLKNDYTIYFS